MKRKRPELTIEHIREVMDREIVIGSDRSHDGYRIHFVFHPATLEFRVHHDNRGMVASSGSHAPHEILEIYSDL